MNAKLLPKTPFGAITLVWDWHGGRPVVLRVLLPQPSQAAGNRAIAGVPGTAPGSCAAIDSVANAIQALLAGQDIRFPIPLVAMDSCPPFQQAVLRLTHRIPRGQTASYGQLAKRLGKPGAARAVGQALAANPFPLLIPCHRVIRSDGHPGGFEGGPAMKRALLALEEGKSRGRLPSHSLFASGRIRC